MSKAGLEILRLFSAPDVVTLPVPGAFREQLIHTGNASTSLLESYLIQTVKQHDQFYCLPPLLWEVEKPSEKEGTGPARLTQTVGGRLLFLPRPPLLCWDLHPQYRSPLLTLLSAPALRFSSTQMVIYTKCCLLAVSSKTQYCYGH